MKKLLFAVVLVVLASFAVPALASTNPFMDVPASHWAYDAVAQLASRGVISGYPDGSYKGAQPATRYEMASIVARALATVDMDKASKTDVEMLKKLVVEFKDELDALGVKVDELDSRLAVLEKDLGGWSLAGELRFDAKFGSDSNEFGEGWYADDATYYGKNEFDLNRYRLFIRKRIDENTSFTGRLGKNIVDGTTWQRYYVTTKIFGDVDMTIGKQFWDWEGDLNLVADSDALFGCFVRNMLRFQKNWGMADMDLIIARNFDDLSAFMGLEGIEQFLIAGKIGVDINEKFMLGVMGYWAKTDRELVISDDKTDTDLVTYGVYAGYKFTPSVELKGIYYGQDQGGTIAAATTAQGDYSDSASAWRVILDLDQDLLKFTSAALEYAKIDNNFVLPNNPYAWLGAEILANTPANSRTATVYGIHTAQKWNDTWRSFARYYTVDFDTAGYDDASNWTVGVGYRLNPAVEFELAYDSIDYGYGSDQDRNGDDSIIRFRTFVTF